LAANGKLRHQIADIADGTLASNSIISQKYREYDATLHGDGPVRAQMHEKNEDLQSIFQKIMAATGIKDLGALVKSFIQGEEKNFALFKFVNELNAEVDNFETQIMEMQSEIERNLAEGGQGSVKRQEIKEMEGKLKKVRAETAQMEHSYEIDSQKILQIKACIGKISDVIECDIEANQELVGQSGITESNMFIYMGMVEERINELLQAYAYIKTRRLEPVYDHVEDSKDFVPISTEREEAKKIKALQEKIMMPGIFQHAGQMGIGAIEPPSFDADDDDEEEDFGKNRKKIKQGLKIEDEKSETTKGVDFGMPGMDDDDVSSDDADMFAVPMNSEAFMAKIVAQQQSLK
jgi:hypothetical protein